MPAQGGEAPSLRNPVVPENLGAVRLMCLQRRSGDVLCRRNGRSSLNRLYPVITASFCRVHLTDADHFPIDGDEDEVKLAIRRCFPLVALVIGRVLLDRADAILAT